MNDIQSLLKGLHSGDLRSLARCISIVENNLEGYSDILSGLQTNRNIPIIGFTGPPGAGKSSLINALIQHIAAAEPDAKIGIIAIDPSSPFNFGALMGDRLRMSEHFNNPNVFIRSMATRGSLGGLTVKTIETADIMRASGFNYIIIETAGVGQTEVEITGLADTTIVVLVPEAGDEIQVIKSGIMEIADIFVVNKSDRDGALSFVKNLNTLVHSHPKGEWDIPVIQTVATKNTGIETLFNKIREHNNTTVNKHIPYLFTEKAMKLIVQHRMKDVDKNQLLSDITKALNQHNFNLYNFISAFIREHKL